MYNQHKIFIINIKKFKTIDNLIMTIDNRQRITPPNTVKNPLQWTDREQFPPGSGGSLGKQHRNEPLPRVRHIITRCQTTWNAKSLPPVLALTISYLTRAPSHGLIKSTMPPCDTTPNVGVNLKEEFEKQ